MKIEYCIVIFCLFQTYFKVTPYKLSSPALMVCKYICIAVFEGNLSFQRIIYIGYWVFSLSFAEAKKVGTNNNRAVHDGIMFINCIICLVPVKF